MTTIKANEVELTGEAGRSLAGDAVRRLRRDPVAVICFVIICAYAIIAIVSPLVFRNWNEVLDYHHSNAPPSWLHPLGTDIFGRGIFAKTLLGAHVSMYVAFFANIISVPLGMLLGAAAGYFGRWIDDAIVWLYTTVASVPGIIRLIALTFALQSVTNLSGLVTLIIALGFMSWVDTCRLVRAETMKLRELDYVLAARAAGRRSPAILLTHIIPNVAHIGVINFSLGFVGAIMAEVTLTYLGLGVKDKPSWGSMIDGAKMDLIVGRWTEFAAAVVAMFIIVLAWNIFGDRLRDALDPKLRNV